MLPAAIGRSDVSWNGLCICVARRLSRAARVRRLAFQVRMTVLEADRLTLRRRTEAGLAKRLQSIVLSCPMQQRHRTEENLMSASIVEAAPSFVPAPRQRHVQCVSPSGLHRMAYTEWGDPANPRVLVCVHGLTRSGRDLDGVANALGREYQVVCPDVDGRGLADCLGGPQHYAIPQHVSVMDALSVPLHL